MADLVISKLPGRVGVYLCIQDEAGCHTIARFTRGEESANELVDWAIKHGIPYVEED